MPRTTEELLGLLELEKLDPDLFRGSQPVTVLQRSFGGQVLAQALSAAYRTVESDRLAHSLNAFFLRPGSYSHADCVWGEQHGGSHGPVAGAGAGGGF